MFALFLCNPHPANRKAQLQGSSCSSNEDHCRRTTAGAFVHARNSFVLFAQERAAD